MPKSSKVTQREQSNEPVTESVADLLALEEPVDYRHSVLNVAGENWNKQQQDVEDPGDDRPAWNNKLQYILAQIGYSVGLGNVWRFPYLCQKNGGADEEYFSRLICDPLTLRQYMPPFQSDPNTILFSLCQVCLFVGLYYNVIIGWSIFYFFKSFQYPLPWSECPLLRNGSVASEYLVFTIWYERVGILTNFAMACIHEMSEERTVHHVTKFISFSAVEPECDKSSATTYFWYRDALDISNSISEGGGLNWRMTLCLLAAWSFVCLAMIKGIQSSGKVMYFSSLFPYVVLICFLVRGLLLRGAVDGIVHMFTPKLDKMLDLQVWREAATQVFFALGLGFGGVIAFSSYNKQDNNCHFDAALVSFINFFTSVLATLVVFAVLGFKANVMNEKCVIENAEKILGYLNSNILSHALIPPQVNFSHLTAKDYTEMYGVIKTVKKDQFQKLGLDPCILEDELDKSVQGTGLAFIAFTEAMTHFPASPFWSVMFFLMLINLGLGSMIGTMAGITTPIIDIFMQELTEMLGFRPYRFYFYTWKYVSPICMAGLMTASIIQLVVTPPGYNAWIREEAAEKYLYYPKWAMGVLVSLIILAILPLPVVFILRQFHLVSDGSNALSVTYKKGRMMKDISNLEDNDETRFILSKVPSETPSPMPTHRSYLGPGTTSPMEMSSVSNGRYSGGYLMATTPESEL
ncbi:hypothetical protein JD844_018172 [Phrynosoma platyrhinos]|uniref:Sodium-dependent neutral amino acid transporter SLC6A17 n=1 Tax=Phrynosoma platyrhinos TaxID=52577 RepID=A0ABQ7SN34_PHRPL|nr:hypothetical protein JD844_018172 [Phrynosoma platyrhinos]